MSEPDRAPEADDLGEEALAVAEYASLRSEILKLIELQSQLVSLAVLAVGAILGVAVQVKNSNLAFVYPILALILGITWLNHALAIGRCAKYLSQDFERRHANSLGWERFVRKTPLRFGMLGYWGIRSVFMGSSLVASLIGWSLMKTNWLEVAVGAASSLVTIGTFVLFFIWREASPKELLTEDTVGSRDLPVPRPQMEINKG